MIKKIAILILIILCTPIIAGFYGVIHDQISFTISSEYYTKFKFDQFGVGPEVPYRLGASYVGWIATWWMGIPLGIILGLIGLIQFDWRLMLKAYYKSLPWIIGAALLTGLLGLIYGRLFLIDKDLNWFIPANLIDRKHFIMVGSMHNFSYIGGLTGLLIGIVYQIKFKIKTGANNRSYAIAGQRGC
jgi:hypothetical protein